MNTQINNFIPFKEVFVGIKIENKYDILFSNDVTYANISSINFLGTDFNCINLITKNIVEIGTKLSICNKNDYFIMHEQINNKPQYTLTSASSTNNTYQYPVYTGTSTTITSTNLNYNGYYYSNSIINNYKPTYNISIAFKDYIRIYYKNYIYNNEHKLHNSNGPAVYSHYNNFKENYEEDFYLNGEKVPVKNSDELQRYLKLQSFK